MKHTLFLTMLAAALLGGQVFANDYKVSDYNEWDDLKLLAYRAETIIVDAQITFYDIYAAPAKSLTLDYQGDFVLKADDILDTPDPDEDDDGVLNITSTVDAVKTKWEDAFSVEGGGSITLCHGELWVDSSRGPVQFFGKEANNTVQLGNTEVMFMGEVVSKEALAMNQVGVVWGGYDIYLVGKVQKSVPEPTTGSLSLLALAGLCARRRRK